MEEMSPEAIGTITSILAIGMGSSLLVFGKHSKKSNPYKTEDPLNTRQPFQPGGASSINYERLDPLATRPQE